MTLILLAIKIVMRHSYTPESLYPDWQKPRRASLLSAVYQDPARNRRAFVAQPPVIQQRLLILPAGRYKQADIGDIRKKEPGIKDRLISQN
jgi:hypothetical protein